MDHNLENELESELEGETAHQQEAELENELELEGEGESEAELEAELEAEDELEGEGESELEAELEGEDELEGELEGEDEFEGELEGEEFFGNLLSGAAGLLGGLGESELEGEDEFEGELEGEEFFGNVFRGIGRFVKNNAGTLKSIAKVALPLVATAVGGPLAGKLGQFAANQINEGEMESEYEDELESEQEDEVGSHESEEEAMAELMASMASESESESEAEAMVGGATTIVLARRDRRALRRVIPHMVRGAAILTRILRRHRRTRPAVRVVPTIVNRTKRILLRGVAAGRPVTRRRAARIMARQTRRVLGSPRACRHALLRSVRKAGRATPRFSRLARRKLRGGLNRGPRLRRLRRLVQLRRQRGF
jgi:hypothetical protein